MQLHYENPQTGATACYNGNISEWSWQQGTNTQQLYAFNYDNVNRLQQATHKAKSGSSWIANSNHYEEKGITYDRNGNILTLQRTGNGTLVDNLAYTYTGNQLTTLEEAVRTTNAADVYAPGSTPNGTYEYDANGNMKKDTRKGLEFTYNILNLLSEVKENGVVKATYQYMANGTKLSVRGNGNSGYDYDGSFVYTVTNNTAVLEAAHFANGQLKANGVNYALTDHLGSMRVMVDASGTVQQQTDYYPFGSQHVNANYADNNNRYTFSGKEQQSLLDLNMYDFGARMYDGALARWVTVDPLCENYYPISSYSYCLNNPINYIDSNGEYVYAMNIDAIWNIIYSILPEEAIYINFDNNGMLDSNLLLQCTNPSVNMLALQVLALSPINYVFGVVDEDLNGNPFRENNGDGNFLYGVTMFPDAENDPSPNQNVYILTAIFLSPERQVINMAHEAYGHALFYELIQYDSDYDPYHRYIWGQGEEFWDEEFKISYKPLIRIESNIKLKNQIDKVTNEAKRNFKNRTH